MEFPKKRKKKKHKDMAAMCMCAQLCPTLWDSMDCSLPVSPVHGIFRQEYWSGLSFPPPENLPDPVIETASPVSPALGGEFFTTEPPGKPWKCHMIQQSHTWIYI